MHAIAYVSAASWNLLDEQVEHIVAESRRLNALNGVTGVLLYCDGNFMQYIEGEEDAVVETFVRIRASESHCQLNELMNQPILEREFGDWAMASRAPVPRSSALEGHGADRPGRVAAALVLGLFARTTGLTGLEKITP